jgi:hypothetical protein
VDQGKDIASQAIIVRLMEEAPGRWRYDQERCPVPSEEGIAAIAKDCVHMVSRGMSPSTLSAPHEGPWSRGGRTTEGSGGDEEARGEVQEGTPTRTLGLGCSNESLRDC